MPSCAFVQWPDGLDPAGSAWNALRQDIAARRPDILITNEMPFGSWLANSERFDRPAAERSVVIHQEGLKALAALNVPLVISSRPVWGKSRLANEAFAVISGQVRPLHRKQFFPDEPGWYESTWYEGGERAFDAHDIGDIKIGILLCTDLMFNEQARHYGRSGVDLIAVPRAAGLAHRHWSIAGAMAAIVSGSYVISSNRISSRSAVPSFGGFGFAFAPDGSLIAETSAEKPLAMVDLDLETARRQKKEYPCYVAELPID